VYIINLLDCTQGCVYNINLFNNRVELGNRLGCEHASGHRILFGACVSIFTHHVDMTDDTKCLSTGKNTF